MKKTKLSRAIALCIGAASSPSYAVDVDITSMDFGGIFLAEEQLRDDTGDFGLMLSVDLFVGNPWSAVGIAYFEVGNPVPTQDNDAVSDEASVTNGANPLSWGPFTQTTSFDAGTGEYTWSGTSVSGPVGDPQKPFSYTFQLNTNEVAWGTLFNWNGTQGIPVLNVMDCTVPAACVGVPGTPMVNGPFSGQDPLFNGIGSDFTPVAVDDASSASEGTTKTIDVALNDFDLDDPASPPITVPAPPTVNLPSLTSDKGGTLVNNGDGTVDYTSVGLTAPDTDTFQYSITDASGKTSNFATVTVSITAFVNEPPVATGGVAVVDEDASVDILINDVATDTDIPAQTLTFVNVGDPLNGIVVANIANDTLTYTPDADYNGPDSFTYSVNDGFDNSATAGTIDITVNPVNDAPTCTTASLATDTDATLVITGSDLATNCTDKEGDTVTYVSLSATQPTNASLSDDGADTITIVPDTGFTGDDSFQFNVTDGNVGGEITADASLKIGTVFSNFTMLDNFDTDGKVFGGTNDILFEWDEQFNTDASDTTIGHMTIETAKPQPFFSFFWLATRIRVYEGPAEGEPPRHLEFDTSCSTAQYEAGTTECGGLKIKMDIPPAGPNGIRYIAGHILFHWGQPDAGSPCGVDNCDIDVVDVWQPEGVWDRHGKTGLFNQLWDGPAGVAPDPEGTWEWVTIDSNGDGINGQPMIDGPFQGLYATYNLIPSGTGEAKPPFVNTQQDTKLDDSVFSMNIAGLLASLMMLLGLRHIGRKK